MDGGAAGRAGHRRPAIDNDHDLHAARGEFLRRLGRPDEARVAYLCADENVHEDADRRLLERRLAELNRPRR